MKLILRWLLNAIAIYIIAQYLPGLSVGGFYSALIVVFVLGLINAVIRPILLFFTLPINILTLGLFTFVINGLLFWFASTIVKGFEVAGFWPAFWGALLLSIVSWVVSDIMKNRTRI